MKQTSTAKKCLYSGEEHTPIENEEGGFIYCAECGDIIKVVDQRKYDLWFVKNKVEGCVDIKGEQ